MVTGSVSLSKDNQNILENRSITLDGFNLLTLIKHDFFQININFILMNYPGTDIRLIKYRTLC